MVITLKVQCLREFTKCVPKNSQILYKKICLLYPREVCHSNAGVVQMQILEDFSYANPQCFSTLKEKTQPYVGGKGQLFTVDYVPMVPLLSGKPTFKSAISLFYPRLRLASFVPMGLHSPASLPKAYKWKENCP